MERDELELFKKLGIPVAFGIRQVRDENGYTKRYKEYTISAEEYENYEDEGDEE